MPKVSKKESSKGTTDVKPKGRKTAYSIFVQTCRDEHRKKNPNSNVNFAEFSKACSERWNKMSDKEKGRFKTLADKDKIRYEKEMANYVPPKGSKKGKKKKDPNAPKRSLSAFFWFCADERPKVRAQKPDASVGDIAKELGIKWKHASNDTKKKYEALAVKDKARYDRESAQYKAKGKSTPKKGKARQDSDDSD
jgi:high mobility group protein B1